MLHVGYLSVKANASMMLTALFILVELYTIINNSDLIGCVFKYLFLARGKYFLRLSNRLSSSFILCCAFDVSPESAEESPHPGHRESVRKVYSAE